MANETTENSISGFSSIPVTAPTSKTALTPKGVISLDPTQTQSILENMQRMIDQRESALSLFTGGLKDAAAWGSGGAEGPTRGLAVRDELKQKEAKELFDMRTQMAAYKAAQNQAMLDQTRLQNIMGGGGEGGGQGAAATSGNVFSNLTPEAQDRVKNARNATEALAIIDEDLKNRSGARAKGMFEAAGNKPEKYFIPGYGFQDLTPNQFLNLPQDLKTRIQQETLKRLGYVPGQQSTAPAAAPSAPAAAPSVPAAAPANDTYRFENLTPELKDRLRQTEEQMGLRGAVLDRPDAAENFNGMPFERRKAIFDFTKTTPATATAPAAPAATKVTAVPPPVGGAPFIGDTQTASEIPAFNEPKPDPKKYGSSAEYEGAKADWEKRRDAALEIGKKFQEQQGEKSTAAFGEAEKTFITLTDQKKLGQREQITNQLDAWMKRWGENPRVLEVLSKPTFANAVADALSQGVQLSSLGTLSVPGIERILQASMPGLKGEEVTALKQLSSIMGPRILQIVEQSKGSSSDKDWAAFNQIAGNANTGYDFLQKAIKYDRVSLTADKADRSLYNSFIKPGKVVDYRAFAADPRRNEIYDTYQKEVQNIAAMKHERIKAPPRPANMPKNVPAQYSPSTNSYWIGNTEYKVTK